MANPATLKPQPFKKGEDPRRHKKQKGEVSAKTKILTFLEEYWRWCKKEGKEPQEKIDELFSQFEKLAKKNWKALAYLFDRLFGKVPEKVEMETKIEEIKKIEEALRKLAEEGNEQSSLPKT